MKYANLLTRHLTAIAVVIAILLMGRKRQITRKADWETHFTDLHFVDTQHGRSDRGVCYERCSVRCIVRGLGCRSGWTNYP